MTLKPIPIRVLRHACPHCGRTHSRPGRAREHMARCWFNTDAKTCKTCKHFEPATGEPAEPDIGYGGYYEPEFCHVGVDLTGGAEIKPGPIVHCDRWEIDNRLLPCDHGSDCPGSGPDCAPAEVTP